jgi:hypothetical protein
MHVHTVSGGGLLPIAAGIGMLGLGAAALVGAKEADAVAENKMWVSQGGTPHGSRLAQWLGKRNVLMWGVRQLVNPARASWVLTTHRAEGDARTLENQLFHAGEMHYGKKPRIGYDNGPDAFRHTYASALIVYRLMRERGADAAQAAAFLQGAGNAHERDSWLHVFSARHSRYSSEVDVNNNLLGQRIGQLLATQHATQGVDELAGEVQVRDAVLQAIGDGIALDGDLTGITRDDAGRARAIVLDQIETAPRASTWTDIASVDASGRPQRDASGALTLRTHVPDAAGFPTPIRDGKVDLSMPYAALGTAQLKLPRDDVPQA